MSDRELLQLAAKAGGVVGEYECWAGQGFVEGIRQILNGSKCHRLWNPLTDDGDALRLAVKLGLDFYEGDDDGRAAYVGYYERRGNTKPPRFMIERHDAHADPYAATRRAIVRAAAAVGASQ